MQTTKKILIGGGVVVVLVAAFFGLWFIFVRTPSPTGTSGPNSTINNTQSFNTGTGANGTNTPLSNQLVDTTNTPQQKIFKIADGPVEGATFVQTSNPTTTLARYVMQDSGHVFDAPVGVSGAIAQVVSNITIPGLGSSLWFTNGTATIVQYAEGGVVKTVYLGLATTTSKVRFLPDGIVGLAASPDGSGLVYLLPSNNGVVGYKASPDGTGAKKLFSSQLSYVILSWPSQNTLLLQSKEAAGVPGIAFSISAATGVMTPLVYAPSLSATANLAFSKLVYQTAPDGGTRTTYAHDVATGKDLQLPFNPLPEKCVWSPNYSAGMYCAAPLTATPSNYLDLWHQGLFAGADSIFSFDINRGITSLVALPGGTQGGAAGDVASLAVSPDGQYLLFITKGDRTLRGVKLGN